MVPLLLSIFSILLRIFHPLFSSFNYWLGTSKYRPGNYVFKLLSDVSYLNRGSRCCKNCKIKEVARFWVCGKDFASIFSFWSCFSWVTFFLYKKFDEIFENQPDCFLRISQCLGSGTKDEIRFVKPIKWGAGTDRVG